MEIGFILMQLQERVLFNNIMSRDIIVLTAPNK